MAMGYGGLFHHAKCGGTMRVNYSEPGKLYTYYSCQRHNDVPERCPGMTTSLAAMDIFTTMASQLPTLRAEVVGGSSPNQEDREPETPSNASPMGTVRFVTTTAPSPGDDAICHKRLTVFPISLPKSL